MVEKVKIFYFSVFIFVVIAFIFHINAMGHHHWKMATAKNIATTGFNFTTIGLFTRCVPSESNKTETCFPNLYPTSGGCTRWSDCLGRSGNDACQCDYLPSTKGIAACTIIAAIFLGLAIIILFLHSIKTTASRAVELFLGLFPLILLLLSFSFILIALILVGSYLSRDVMYIIQTVPSKYISENYKKNHKFIVFNILMTCIRKKVILSYEFRFT
jgi:hypothetical protein